MKWSLGQLCGYGTGPRHRRPRTHRAGTKKAEPVQEARKESA